MSDQENTLRAFQRENQKRLLDTELSDVHLVPISRFLEALSTLPPPCAPTAGNTFDIIATSDYTLTTKDPKVCQVSISCQAISVVCKDLFECVSWYVVFYNPYAQLATVFDLYILLSNLANIQWPAPNSPNVFMSIPIEHSEDYHRARIIHGLDADAGAKDLKDLEQDITRLMHNMPRHLTVEFLWLRAVPTAEGSKEPFEWALMCPYTSEQ